MKIMLIGDLHHGAKGNDTQFNEHICDFVDWVCALKEKYDITTCIQLGDYFDQRHKIDVSTLNYGIHNAKKLSQCYGKDNTYVLAGNHDMYHLSRLDVISLIMLEPYLTVVDELLVLDKLVLSPWIIDGEMWDNVCNLGSKCDYLFAHLELNGFKVNDQYLMEHGFSHKELKNYNKVFTGHYHSMQEMDNILYVGTPYPITMNEANEDHGVFILDTDDGSVEFVKYDEIKVISIPYTQIESILSLDPNKTSIRIEFPDELADETVISDVQKLLEEYSFSDVKIKFKGQKTKELLEINTDDIVEVENIDQVIVNFIKNAVDIDGIDKDILEKLYKMAIQKGDQQ